jgi:hypothetical protein
MLVGAVEAMSTVCGPRFKHPEEVEPDPDVQDESRLTVTVQDNGPSLSVPLKVKTSMLLDEEGVPVHSTRSVKTSHLPLGKVIGKPGVTKFPPDCI